MVGFDQFLGFLHADFRLELIVGVDDLDRQPAELAAMLVEPQLERVLHVVADGGDRPAEGRDEADLDCLLGRLLGQRRAGE